jgi:hypothetical protein
VLAICLLIHYRLTFPKPRPTERVEPAPGETR